MQQDQQQQDQEDEERGVSPTENEGLAVKQELSHLVSSTDDDTHQLPSNDNESDADHDGELFGDEPDDDEASALASLQSSHRSRNTTTTQQQQDATTWRQWWKKVLLTCALPDNRVRIYGVPLMDGSFSIKLLKFVVVTMLGIACMHWFIRKMQWENRKEYTLEQFYTYESTMVVVDAAFFFVVARLHQQRGVDHLAFVLTLLAANIYASFITTFRFLQHSVTLYQMHCVWPPALWMFVLVLIPLIVTIILWHVQYAVQRNLFVMKLVELVLSVIFLVVPYASSPYLHLHHWYVGWLAGMHANFNVWWSRATLAWCWGLYINGVAVYGRDPVLTCGYTLFLSKQQRCPYLDCYVDGLANPPNDTNTNVPIVHEMNRPDWRNCSADAYHP